MTEKGKTMARDIIEGESIYIPFRNGRSINDTKHKARMYRTLEAFQRHFPGDEYGTDEVVLLEYAPVVHGRWIPVSERMPDHFGVFIVAIKEPGRERVGKDCADFDPFAKTWLTAMYWDEDYEVTHWMPLPEPPKEE